MVQFVCANQIQDIFNYLTVIIIIIIIDESEYMKIRIFELGKKE